MPVRFKLDPASGQYAIYTVPTPTSTDDAPLTNPLGNLSRVIVHPQLRYPGVVATISGTLSLATSSGTYPQYRTHVLGAHGQSGRPMLIGRLLGLGVGGASVPWAGTVCVECPPFGGGAGWPYPGPWPRRVISASRWLSLGVQGGNVVAHELNYNASNAFAISYEVLVLNRDLSGTLQTSGPAQVTYEGNALVMRGPFGTISSEHRYLKDGAGYPAPFALSGGRTTTIRYNATSGSAVVNQTSFNHSFGSSLYEIISDYTTRDVTVSNPGSYVPAGAVNPLIKQVAL